VKRHPAIGRQQGFSLLELGITLAALGVLGLLLSRGYDGSDDRRSQQRARAETEQAHQALQAFMLAQHRLPCPDINGDGREGAGGHCPADARSGWLPLETLGLALRADGRPRYAVYRDAAADLVMPAAAAPGVDADPQDGHRALLRALITAAGQPLSSSQPHLTGDGGSLGSIDCNANVTANSAFVVLAPATDRSGDGDRFDPPHTGYGTVAGLCFASPSAPLAHAYDDIVHATSANALLGWLRTRTR
jgi:hypothetical protein